MVLRVCLQADSQLASTKYRTRAVTFVQSALCPSKLMVVVCELTARQGRAYV